LVDKIAAINEVKMALHAVSPFTNEPVDCVLWLASSSLAANDYNPNSVAPPEMELLRVSVAADGYTQPIVSWRTQAGYEVVDGFHRTRVGKECEEIKRRVHGFLPVVVVNHNRTDRGDRIAATIRHNRARGKHRVDAMSDIVVELRRRNWSEERIGKELGMDPDEVLRLAQITGLAELFADVDFSRAWDIGTLGDTTNDEDDDGPEAA
jgi:ParB-like chromosome segregation protein Spo0J